MRTNKTISNLQTVWNQLDNASGELYNALDSLARMTALPIEVKRKMDLIDVTLIDSLKNGVEYMMENKSKNLCPVCKENELHPVEVRNALSRKDNKTYICSSCGVKESIEILRLFEEEEGK